MEPLPVGLAAGRPQWCGAGLAQASIVAVCCFYAGPRDAVTRSTTGYNRLQPERDARHALAARLVGARARR
jgi:hypothetical protein